MSSKVPSEKLDALRRKGQLCRDIHSWAGDSSYSKVHSCAHAPYSSEQQASRAWLSPQEPSYQALAAIINDPKLALAMEK